VLPNIDVSEARSRRDLPCARRRRVRRPIVLVRGAITESTPKTKTGDRLIWLDSETARLLKEHRKAQVKTPG
jgi:hypothetical protein